MSAIQTITHKHRAIMRDLVLGGLTNQEVLKEYDISESHLSVVVNSPLFKKEAAIMHDNAVNESKRRMLTLLPKSLTCVEEILDRTSNFDIVDPLTGESKEVNVTNPPASRLKAAELVLSAAGLAGKDKGSDQSKNIVINLVQPGWGNEDGKPTEIDIEL